MIDGKILPSWVILGGGMKKARKTKAVKERQILFKSYLIRQNKTQREIAVELGVNMSSITRSIERGVFASGPFAKWWKSNILKQGVTA